ncbi:hypothetical protein FPV67DRAFT_1415327 [Lyophyllum atratum]|nr:hypothetical protein FPV67DRAFT_1415327 [Lyophyllum atratum]
MLVEVRREGFQPKSNKKGGERKSPGWGSDDKGEEWNNQIAGEGPIPKYPRGMLKLRLTDGMVTLPAVEYRFLPGLSLENTPLGYNVRLSYPPDWLIVLISFSFR